MPTLNSFSSYGCKVMHLSGGGTFYIGLKGRVKKTFG